MMFKLCVCDEEEYTFRNDICWKITVERENR